MADGRRHAPEGVAAEVERTIGELAALCARMAAAAAGTPPPGFDEAADLARLSRMASLPGGEEGRRVLQRIARLRCVRATGPDRGA